MPANSRNSVSSSKSPLIMSSVCCLALGLGAGAWWSPRSSSEQDNQDQTQSATPPENSDTKPTTAKPPMKNQPAIKKVKSPADLAKAKGVAPEVKRPNGTYNLVTVIEGVVPNRQLTANLTLVSNQRKKLGELTAKYNSLPETAPQERELYAGQLNDLKKLLTNNLQQMGQAYAYSLSNEYLLVPYSGALHAVDAETKKVSEAPTCEFNTHTDYEAFQRLRMLYMQAQQAKAQAEKSEKDGAAPAADENTAKIQKQLDQSKSELKEKFNCDADAPYEMRLSKSALYAKPLQQ